MLIPRNCEFPYNLNDHKNPRFRVARNGQNASNLGGGLSSGTLPMEAWGYVQYR
jgi:hypothetical protein